jgi:hypothetical protein
VSTVLLALPSSYYMPFMFLIHFITPGPLGNQLRLVSNNNKTHHRHRNSALTLHSLNSVDNQCEQSGIHFKYFPFSIKHLDSMYYLYMDMLELSVGMINSILTFAGCPSKFKKECEVSSCHSKLDRLTCSQQQKSPSLSKTQTS